MICDIPEKLHTFFVPQMEQLGLEEQPARHGSLSKLDDERGQGALWALGIGKNCLFTYHDLVVDEPMRLVEFPDDYICLTSMTDCSARLCPVNSRYLIDRNTVSFKQRASTVSFELNPEEHHRSYTLCMTPEFFDEIPDIKDSEREMIASYLINCDTNSHPREIANALESISPTWATKAGGALFCEGKVKEIIARILDCAIEEESDDFSARSEAKRLAHEAQKIVDERFSENLTLQSVANELFVGRTKLCEIFREEIGVCFAEYVRNARMAEASKLLKTTDLKTSEIGRLVGYSHTSSFSEAFHREFGAAPGKWRRQNETRR